MTGLLNKMGFRSDNEYNKFNNNRQGTETSKMLQIDGRHFGKTSTTISKSNSGRRSTCGVPTSTMISKVHVLFGAVCALFLFSTLTNLHFLVDATETTPVPVEAQLQARRVPIVSLDSVHDAIDARQQRAIANSVTPATFPDAEERDKLLRRQKSEIKTPVESPFGKASELDVKCTNGQSMQLVVKTRLPFDGLIYIGKSGSRSPQCRLEGRGLNRHELTVSLRQCGVILKQKTEAHADYAVHVYVQYNSAIQQAKDDHLYNECRVPIISSHPNKKASTTAENAKIQLQQKLMQDIENYYPQLIGQPEIRDIPVENAWMEILHDNGEQLQDSGEFAVKNGHLLRNDVSLGERLIIAIKTPKPELDADGSVVSDADVVMCRVHDNTENNYEMLSDRYGCPMDSSIMPSFKTYDSKSNPSNELVHYSVIQAFKFPDNNHLHFTCKVIYCTGPCPRVNCTNIELARNVERAAAERKPANAYYAALEENERRAAAAAQVAAFHAFMPIPQDDIMGSGRAITLTPGTISPSADSYASTAAHYSMGSSRYKRDVEHHHILRRQVAQQLGSNAGQRHDELLARHKRQVRNSYYYEDLPFLQGGGSSSGNNNNVFGERDVVNSVRVYNNPNDTAQAAALRQGRDVDVENNNGTASNQTTVVITTKEQIPHGRLFCLRRDLFWAILGLLLGSLLLALLIALLCCCKRRRRRIQKEVYVAQPIREQSPYYYYSESGVPSTGGYQPFPSTTATPAQRVMTTTASGNGAASSIYQYPPYATTTTPNVSGIPPARLRR